jgi:hypothetical protein
MFCRGLVRKRKRKEFVKPLLRFVSQESGGSEKQAAGIGG